MRRTRPAFTLLEVLIVIVVLGVLLTMAFLNLQPMRHRTVLRQGVTEVSVALRTAHSEALRYNVPVTVSVTPGTPVTVRVTRDGQVRTRTLPVDVTLDSVGATPTVTFLPPHGTVAETGAAFEVRHPRVDRTTVVGVTGLIGKVVVHDAP